MLPNLQFLADLVAFTEEIRNRKLHFLCNILILHDLTAFNSLMKFDINDKLT